MRSPPCAWHLAWAWLLAFVLRSGVHETNTLSLLDTQLETVSGTVGGQCLAIAWTQMLGIVS
jgi:hypothetical protein